MKNFEITIQTVRMLATMADLNLDEEREKLIAPQLNEWIQNANKLSGKMSNLAYQSLLPITSIKQKSI